ncbi:murein DD-endopeptidase MepM/ murein hydrolase activator NlpD [Arcanobacterium pluranimalium]|uniref:M23 family metallopeptidase n=1 Tax=Arcanobacterium pluranimalium TaxID=108028 RepID=UPI00195C20EF|nr:M23 family metallopeptidase [Arcanobacterium pluranimalium]MBM7825096.1 murein DD-endopeptidase MepM/ murein hydrolase activator NlpD [Arcanobacterium pluranimalium]
MRKKFLTTVAAFTLVFTGLAVNIPANAADRDDLVNQQNEKQKRIDALTSQLEGIDVNIQQTYLDFEKTRSQLPAAEQAVLDAQNQLSASQREAEANAAMLSAAQAELGNISRDIDKAKDAAEQSRKSLGEFARATYRGETGPSTVDLVFGSSSAQDFIDSYRINSAIARTQTFALTEHEQATASAKNRQARQSAVESTIEELKAKADALVAQNKERKATADQKRGELNSLLAKIDNQHRALENLKDVTNASILQTVSERQAIATEIAKIDEENRRKAAEAAAAGRNGGTANTSGGAYWLHPPIPAPVYVTSPMGRRYHPVTGSWTYHEGVDLRSPCGEVQRAGAGGVVVKTVPASVGGFGGNQVWINHGVVNGSSWITVHLHLTTIGVQVGQQVSQGQVIGTTGQTGRVTGCHVHYEVWKDGVAIDPMTLPGFTQRDY